MNISSLLSVGLTIPALLTASASMLALVIAKENKVTEARQAWINELRDELSRFAALSRQNAQYWEVVEKELSLIPGQTERASKRIDLNRDHLPHAINASTSVARIKLMLAALETASSSEVKSLITRLTEIQRAYVSVDETLRLTIDLHAVAGPVMQAEWRRVRIGEPTYRWVLRFSAGLGVLLLAAILIAAFLGGAQKPDSASHEVQNTARAAKQAGNDIKATHDQPQVKMPH